MRSSLAAVVPLTLALLCVGPVALAQGDAPKGDAPKGDAPKGDGAAPAGDAAPKGDGAAPAGDAPKADDAPVTEEDVGRFLEGKLTFETGKVTVGNNLATIDLPAGWRYLQQKDARFMVEEVWHNPPDPTTLGLVLPKDLPITRTWAIIVSNEDAGHTSDEDAAKLDYADMLKTLQERTRANNAELKKRGYSTQELLGWAEPPHYDAAKKKLYWAKRIQFEGQPAPTLNYDVRILGRRGHLVLTAVADDAELAKVREGCTGILEATEFTAGNRYTDFDASVDKTAAGGIAGLIVGGAVLTKLAKGGLLAKLAKPLILVAIALVAGLGKLFGKKQEPSAGA